MGKLRIFGGGPLKRGLLLGAVLAAGVAMAPAAQAESLSDAMVMAYNTSGLLEQNRALLRATDEDVAQAVAALRPVLNYVTTSTYNFDAQAWTSSLQLQASLTLYDFGASRLAVDSAKESVLAARDSLVGVEQTVLYNAVSAYLDVWEASAIVGLRASNVRLITQELRAANDRFEVGEVTRTDVSLAQAQLAAAQANRAQASADLNIARESYKAAVGKYPGTLREPPRPPLTADTLESAKAIARKRHPDVLSTQRQVTIADLGIARVKASMLPSFSANAGLSATDPGNGVGETFGLRIAGPIYQGGGLRSLERQAIANSEASRSGLIVTVQQVERAVGNAWAQVQVGTASLDATAQQVKAAREAFEGVREEASLGARTTLDVLDAEQSLLDAQVSAISAQTGRYRAVYGLLQAMGLLTAEHLGLGVPRYDPGAYYNAVKGAPLYKVSPQGQKLDRVLKGLQRN